MANKVERTLVARDLAIAAENVASAQVLDTRREVLRLQYHFPDAHSAMRAGTHGLTVAREALAEARRVAEEADRNCEAAFAEARDRRLQTHRERYDALNDEIQDEILLEGSKAMILLLLWKKLSQMPRTRSRGSVSPLSFSREAEYTRSLQPSSESEETEEPGVQDADDTRSDN
ncbi:hypothetical protein V7S43_016638 [Phytophthora oleae]|uniref:Uncharacterized protein n=1 Tax=Phytophthora oleae TaxID=2107226 RepID=A0ABD3EUW2_9STRA